MPNAVGAPARPNISPVLNRTFFLGNIPIGHKMVAVGVRPSFWWTTVFLCKGAFWERSVRATMALVCERAPFRGYNPLCKVTPVILHAPVILHGVVYPDPWEVPAP